MKSTPILVGGASGTAAWVLARETPLAVAMRSHPLVLMGEPELGWFAGTLSYMAYKQSLEPDLDLLISGLSGLAAYVALNTLI